ncbi:DNA-binding NarL/FixJ family response regulator [Phyllobacterium sp. 1468]|uniref:helix-turn-helix transcriptional regulator n=1 Tax=Phyllobacterium sp. 1468 TaxID=2817759 RepID=UPI001AE6F885|nr:response regulator transcription factor [Phyllobacterium sp. 1468]MDR6633380.1 DNA-binding NarL/FixJ family response regulator [Phyllobacterium sp. 1468]
MSGTTPDHIHYASKIEGDSKFKSGIFIYAESGVVFQGLVQSLERTFPDIDVHLSSKFVEYEKFDEDVGLVLIHSGFVADVAECIARFKKRFPSASITMMIDENSAGLQELNSLFDNRQVQGLLPFSLKLDIWLAVIWLLLNGGEYYPSAIIRSIEKNAAGGHANAFGNQGKNSSGVVKQIKTLTLRETQILELLSEGLQNKIIADRLSLSEHTVKVHVHNLIRKLRVHNRTQAAAVYRNSMDQEAYQPPFKAYGTGMGRVDGSLEMARAV